MLQGSRLHYDARGGMPVLQSGHEIREEVWLQLSQQMEGRVGIVTHALTADGLGEVQVSIRGGVESFLAYALDRAEVVEVGTQVAVISYFPPRTVVVCRMP